MRFVHAYLHYVPTFCPFRSVVPSPALASHFPAPVSVPHRAMHPWLERRPRGKHTPALPCEAAAEAAQTTTAFRPSDLPIRPGNGVGGNTGSFHMQHVSHFVPSITSAPAVSKFWLEQAKKTCMNTSRHDFLVNAYCKSRTAVTHQLEEQGFYLRCGMIGTL